MLRDAEMSDHYFAKYGAQEARVLDAERRARSTSREWRNATSGLARKGYRQDSPSSSSPRFKQTSPSPIQNNQTSIETERPWAAMACKRLGKKEWAHAANKMLVSLLQELDTECSTHQEDWTRDRDNLTRQVAAYQNQLVAIQRVLYRVQNTELDKSKKFWMRLVMTCWTRVIMYGDVKRRMRIAVNVACWQGGALYGNEPIINVWAEKIFLTWKVLRLRHQKR